MSLPQGFSGVTVFKIGSRAHCFVLAVFSGLFAVQGVTALIGVLIGKAPLDDILGAIFLILFGGVPSYLVLTQETYEIQVDANSMICFRRVLNQVLLPARSIVTMNKRLGGEDDDIPLLYIRHERGEIKISAVRENEEFVAHILRLNPTIKITGGWTMPSKSGGVPEWIVVLGTWLDRLLGSKPK